VPIAKLQIDRPNGGARLTLDDPDEIMMHKPRRSGEIIDEDGVRRTVRRRAS
jgi:hypothetical protein